jgi:hypothetical protein
MCASFGSAQAAPEDREIPFSQGFDVSFNGSAPIHCGFDSGLAWDFLLSSDHAGQLGLSVIGTHVMHTSDRQEVSGAPSDIVLTKAMTLLGRTFTDRKGLIAPNSHRNDVGITLFSDLLLTLDLPRGLLRVRSGALSPANDQDIIPYTTDPNASFKVLQVSPTITIQLADKPFPALLDTGAQSIYGDVLVPSEVAARLPLGSQLGTVIFADALGRKSTGVVKQLNGDLTIGNITIHKPVITVSDWLGFVNLGPLTKRLVITIDQKNHLVQLIMPAPAADKGKN